MSFNNDKLYLQFLFYFIKIEVVTLNLQGPDFILVFPKHSPAGGTRGPGLVAHTQQDIG